MRKFLNVFLAVFAGMSALVIAACGKDSATSLKNSHKITQSNEETGVCEHCGETLYTLSGDSKNAVTYTLSANKKYYSVSVGAPVEGKVILPSYYKARGDEEYLPVLEASFTSSKITKVELSSVVEEVKFSSCPALEEIIVPETNKEYKLLDGVLFNKSGKKLVKYPAAKAGGEYTVPDGVTEIESRAFARNGALCSLNFSEGLTKINDDAFAYCKKLESVAIPESVTSLGNDAFIGNEGLKNVVLGSNITAIGEHSFKGCEKLANVRLGKNLKTVGSGAFSGCKSLASVTIPDSVTSIYDGAFSLCDSLTDVTFGKGIKLLGNGIFVNSFKLTDIQFNGSVAQWQEVTKVDEWCINVNTDVVTCTDGTVAIVN